MSDHANSPQRIRAVPAADPKTSPRGSEPSQPANPYPLAATPRDILSLQRLHGNHYVVGMMQRARSAPAERIQRVELKLGAETIETDHYSVATLNKLAYPMTYAMNREGFPPPAKEEFEVLQLIVAQRQHAKQFAPLLAPVTNQMVRAEKQQKTMQNNLQARELIRKFLNAGLEHPDELVRNSCETALSTHFKIFAVSPLVESYDVLSDVMRSSGATDETPLDEEASENMETMTLLYPLGDHASDKGDIWSEELPPYDIQDYVALLNQGTTTSIESKTTKGWNRNHVISIVVTPDSSLDALKEFLYSVLKHEIQHAVDDSNQEVNALGARDEDNLMAHAIVRWKTEYRAFWTMGHPYVVKLLKSGKQDQKETFDLNKHYQVTALHNTLSYLAFNDMERDFFMGEDDEDVPDRLPYGKRKKFGEKVANLNPLEEMVNPFNSIRVVGFYSALETGKLAEVEIAAKKLQPKEVKFLLEAGAALQKIEKLSHDKPELDQKVIVLLKQLSQ